MKGKWEGGRGGGEGEGGACPAMPPGVMTVEVDWRLEKKKTDLGKRERARSNTEKKGDNPS